MPWKECDQVSLRVEFCRLANGPDVNMSVLCQRFSISRKTGYKWLHRFREEGEAALVDRSRRPKARPRQTPKEVEEMVVACRRKNGWCARKIRRVLLNQGHANVPAASTITEILRRRGEIRPEDSPQRTWKRFERSAPNDLWQMDFKGHFGLTSGKRCHPLTALDDHSRYSLVLEACVNERRTLVEKHLQTAFRRYGLPGAMLMDNGPPWGTSMVGEWSGLSVWLMEQDIKVLHGAPYHPQTQGKEERFHRSLKREVLQGRSFASFSQVQQSFVSWRQVYNHERPHDALQLDVPASRYRMSMRSYQEKPPPFEYDESFAIRRVESTGRISWRNRSYFIGNAFAGRDVGVRAAEQENCWAVYYRTTRLTELELTAGRPRS